MYLRQRRTSKAEGARDHNIKDVPPPSKSKYIGCDSPQHIIGQDGGLDTAAAAAAAATTSVANAEDAVVGAAVRGGSLLMVLALIQRASTFILNVLLQRAMLPGESENRGISALEEYGAAAITLELISSTALFLAREPFRVALARSCAPPETSGTEGEKSCVLSARSSARREAYRRRFVNTAWLSAPVGVAFTAVVWLVYPRLIQNDAFLDVKENREAVTLVCIAAAIELTCEPLALIFQYQLLVGVRVRAEATAVLVLGISRYLLVAWAGVGVLSFGYAQLLHSATLAAAYLLSTARQVGKGDGMAVVDTLAQTTTTLQHIGSSNANFPGAESSPSVLLAQRGRKGGAQVNVDTIACSAEFREEQTCNRGFSVVTGWLPRRPSPSPAVPESSIGSDAAHGLSVNTDEGKFGRRQERRKGELKEADDYGASEWVDQGQLRLAGAIAGQSVLKHVLTEGDKIVLARASSSFGNWRCTGGDSGTATAGDGVGICETGVSGGGDRGGSLYEQGVYALASGYGSLAARLLFQPLEEAARLMFSKLGAEEEELRKRYLGHDRRQQPMQILDGDDNSNIKPVRSSYQMLVESSKPNRTPVKGKGGADGNGAFIPPSEDHEVAEQDMEEVRRRIRGRMADLLATLLKLVLSTGLVFVCFGFHYTETLLRLLLGSRGRGEGGGDGPNTNSTVSQVATVLSWYCVYVLFLAANGMCEAFACAVARGRQLTGMGAGLIASFAAFWMLVGPLTSRFGTRGLVMANAAGMACRVIFSGIFIRRFFLDETEATVTGPTNRGNNLPETKPDKNMNLWRRVVKGALPHPVVVAVMVISSGAARLTSPYPFGVAGGRSGGGGGILSSSWDIRAAAKHVGIGAMFFVLTAVVFGRFERRFLRELRNLWAARRSGEQS